MSTTIDRHGYTDIRLEGWENNVRFERNSEIAVLSGCSVNALLNSIFILYGHDDNLKLSLPGGSQCWDDILETVYVTITSYLTIFEIIVRIRYLCEDYLYRRKEYTEKLIISQLLHSTSNLIYGSFLFLYTWVANFHSYLSESELVLLRRGIVCIGNLGIRNITGKKPIDLCGDSYRKLEVLIDIVSQERSILVNGIRSNITTTTNYQSMKLYLSKYNPNLYDFIKNEKIYTETGPFRYIYHNRDYFTHVNSMTYPKLRHSQTIGLWDEKSANIRKETVKKLTSASKYKVDLFGGNSLFDDDNDDDDNNDNDGNDNNDDNNSNNVANHSSTTQNNSKQLVSGISTTKTYAPMIYSGPFHPIPHVSKGISLLEAPITMMLEPDRVESISTPTDDLWSYELIELARQLTLLDHAMFCAIPMQCFISTAWTNPRHTLSAMEYKRFSDRFNALSLWATTCVLREDEPSNRAKKYGQIVLLTSHLLELGNYNSAMALLSSLRQGCITRLEITLSKITKKTRDLYMSLQKRLSDQKNYFTYRQEIDKRVNEIQNPFEWKNRMDGIDPRLKKSYSSISISSNAMVPYLGIYTSDLAGIHDGNTDQLPEAPHLIHLHKYILITKLVQLISKIQTLSYSLEPVRSIAASWNHLMKSYTKLTARDSKRAGDNLFSRSMALETSDMIESYHQSGDIGYDNQEDEDKEENNDRYDSRYRNNGYGDEEEGQYDIEAQEQDNIVTKTKKNKLFSVKKIFKSFKQTFSKNKSKEDT